MQLTLTVTLFIAALAAAARSTWSPCGWSMLSTITPLAERSRRHRWSVTVTWFITGAFVGGSALGAIGALGALVTRQVGIGLDIRLGFAALAAVLAAAVDAGAVGPPLPHLRRQVDERWLDEFRPWVYGCGFGLQIGFGLVTYIMTSGLYLTLILAALTASPTVAGFGGLCFGATRGAAVLLGIGNRTPDQLAAFHRTFASVEQRARWAVVATFGAIGAVLAAAGFGPAGSAAALAALIAVGVRVASVRSVGPVGSAGYESGPTVTPDRASFSIATSDERRASDPTTA